MKLNVQDFRAVCKEKYLVVMTISVADFFSSFVSELHALNSVIPVAARLDARVAGLDDSLRTARNEARRCCNARFSASDVSHAATYRRP